MRAHTSDHDDGTTRPQPARQLSQDAASALRALASGRPEAIGPRGLLHLQRAAGNAGVASLMAEEESPVKDVVGKGGGRPLDADLRADMEGRFGADFGDVRIHTDAKATSSAKAVGAHAYTAGSDVVFQRDHYAPDTDAGKRTLAHELTHVLQQRAGPVAGTPTPGGISLSHPSDPFEQAATTTAARVMSAPAGAVQRQIGNRAVARALADGVPTVVQRKINILPDEQIAANVTEPNEVVETIQRWFTRAGREGDMSRGRRDILALMAQTAAEEGTFKESDLDGIVRAIDSYAARSEPLLSEHVLAKLGEKKNELKAKTQPPFEEEGATVHRILSYFSGEVPIHAAAMHMDPNSKIELYYDAQYYLVQYARSASLEGLATPHAYHTEVLGRDKDKGGDAILAKMLQQGYESVERMRQELTDLGIHPSRIRLVYVDNIDTAPIKRRVSDTHASVAKRFQTDEAKARDSLREQIFKDISPERKNYISEIPSKLGLKEGTSAALLWQRYSGLAPGGAYPELDTNLRMLDQVITMIQKRFPTYRVILVGDNPPDPKYVNQLGKGLVQFWAPNTYGLNRAEQVFLLDLLCREHAAVAIGMESGAIELPALLGMRTVYMERSYMRTGKAERWSYVSGSGTQDEPGGEAQAVSGAVSTWRRQQFEAPTEWLFPFKRLKRLRTRVDKASSPNEYRAALAAIRAVLGSWHNDVQELSNEVTATEHAEVDWVGLNRQLAGILLTLFARVPDPSDFDEDNIGPATEDYAEKVLHLFLGDFENWIDTLRLSEGELNHLEATIRAMPPATEVPKEKRTYQVVSKENRATAEDPYHYGKKWLKGLVELQPYDVNVLTNAVRDMQSQLVGCNEHLEVCEDASKDEKARNKAFMVASGKLRGLENNVGRVTPQLDAAKEKKRTDKQGTALIYQLDGEFRSMIHEIEVLGNRLVNVEQRSNPAQIPQTSTHQ